MISYLEFVGLCLLAVAGPIVIPGLVYLCTEGRRKEGCVRVGRDRLRPGGSH